MCGITTGGREDCFWDCEVESTGVGKGLLLTPPECLLDCFSKVYFTSVRYQNCLTIYFQNSCFYHLIKDFKKKGICNGFDNPANFPTSWCKTKPKFVNLGINSFGLPKFKTIINGVCSKRTEKLLQRKECEFVLNQQSNIIYKSLLFLLLSMCRSEIYKQWNIFPPTQTSRLVPLHTVMELEDATISTNLNLGMVMS